MSALENIGPEAPWKNPISVRFPYTVPGLNVHSLVTLLYQGAEPELTEVELVVNLVTYDPVLATRSVCSGFGGVVPVPNLQVLDIASKNWLLALLSMPTWLNALSMTRFLNFRFRFTNPFGRTTF